MVCPARTDNVWTRNAIPVMVIESEANVMFVPYITGRFTGLIAVISGKPKVTAFERVPTAIPDVTEIRGFHARPFENLPDTEESDIHNVVSNAERPSLAAAEN